MQLSKLTNNWMAIGSIFLVSMFLLSLWVGWSQLENKYAITLTPEAVVEAFRMAGYIVEDVQEIDEYPVPLLPSEHGTRFSVDTPDGKINVSVVLYSSESEAKHVKSSIIDFSHAMSSKYVLYGFSRGSVVLSFVTNDKKVAQQFNNIFRSAD